MGRGSFEKWVNRNHPDWTIREFLHEYYVLQEMNTTEIAEMLGGIVTSRTILRHLHSNGLIRSMSEARRLFWGSEKGNSIKEKAFKRISINEPRPQIQQRERRLLKKRQGNRCLICDEPLKPYLSRVHHIKALALGGTNDLSNLIVLCFECHDRVHLGDIDTILTLKRAVDKLPTVDQGS
jgi:5-methylcytosine-specific restriction endonuclease McrA